MVLLSRSHIGASNASGSGSNPINANHMEIPTGKTQQNSCFFAIIASLFSP